MPKEESSAAPGTAAAEGRQGSAGSNEGNSGSRSKDPSSGETEAISEPQPPLLQRQVCLISCACARAVQSAWALESSALEGKLAATRAPPRMHNTGNSGRHQARSRRS